MNPKLKVFYDGGCVVCNHEINFYKKRDTNSRIDWIDINKPGFDASSFGLHPMKVRERFHSITETGEVLDGVESFVKIWKTMQIFRILILLAEWRPTRYFMDLGYIVFSKLRPYLPRRKDLGCDTGACEITYTTPETLSKIP